jgi:hypothetical protein
MTEHTREQLGEAARLWCLESTRHIVMIPELAEAIADTLSSRDKRIAALEAELERERIRLAACGVVAMANTTESAASARQMLPEYHSASCDDVARAVDKQMELQAELKASQQREAELREALEGVLADLKRRGRKDSDGVIMLGIGNSVLFKADKALSQGREG